MVIYGGRGSQPTKLAPPDIYIIYICMGVASSVVFYCAEPAQTSFSPPFPPLTCVAPPSSEAAPQVSPIFFILKKWGGAASLEGGKG